MVIASDLSQHLSTLGYVILAAFFAYIALDGKRSSRLGREALLLAAGFFLFTAVLRTLSITQVTSVETTRTTLGITTYACIAILAQIAWLRRLDGNLKDEQEHQL
jgi:hypothetical protein